MKWNQKFKEVVHNDNVIQGFVEEYSWASNFYEPCKVVYEGLEYNSSEAAYQSAKTTDMKIRKLFTQYDAGESKKFGNKRAHEIGLVLRSDWDAVKLQVMFDICLDKFTRNEDLKTQLSATGERYLEETNWWGDSFWGVVDGKGNNHLGFILMAIRDKLSESYTRNPENNFLNTKIFGEDKV